MKIKWTANWGLKIGSLIFAAVLWLLVTNINDPITPKSFNNVPVKITHGDLITSSGRVYEVLGGSDVIEKVTVRAPRSVVESLSLENIVAVADMNDLSSLDTISIKLSTTIYNNRVESIRGNEDTVKLKIENRETKTLALQVTTSGEVEKGYLVGDITTEQNQVRISGPASVIAKVAKATVDVEVSKFTSDIVTDLDIRLYDADDAPVSTANITLNITSVKIRVGILETKTIPVYYTVIGTPAMGYRATGVVESNIDQILIAGRSNVIKNVSALEIPESVLDISGKSEDFVANIDLSQYLPDNVKLDSTSAKGNATVTVYIEPETSRDLWLRSNRIKIVNMPDGYTGSFSGVEDEFTIHITGLGADVEAIRAADVVGLIDIQKLMADRNMEEIAEGFYTMSVDFNLGENVTVLEPIEVVLHITSVEE